MQVMQILSNMNALFHFSEILCIMTQDISREVLLDVFLAVLSPLLDLLFSWKKVLYNKRLWSIRKQNIKQLTSTKTLVKIVSLLF